MASSRCSSQQLLALFLIYLIVRPALGDPATQQRINVICFQMEEYGFCNRTFNEILRGAPADYVELTRIANDQALKNATNTRQFIQQLIDVILDPTLRVALQTCENGYALVEQAFQQGVFYFNQKDYDSMLKVERIAPRAEGSCDVIFSTPPAKPNPLLERNREMRILIAMALVSGHQLST